MTLNCLLYLSSSSSCRAASHGYPWASLATSAYRSLPLAGLQGYIPYPHIAAVCMFELVVLLLPGHMWRSIGVHNLWVRPCFSSSVLQCFYVYTSALLFYSAIQHHKRQNRDHPDHSTNNINKNSEKSSWYLCWLAVTQTSVKIQPF